jgi:hypothetical protein
VRITGLGSARVAHVVVLLHVGVIAALLARPALAQGTRTLNVVATDYALDVPDAVGAGMVQVRLLNKGKERHQILVVRLPEGVSYEEAERAVTTNRFDDAGLKSFSGPAATADTSRPPAVLMELRPGRYFVLCSATGAGGSHFRKGMRSRLTVIRGSRWGAIAPPLINEKIRLYDDRVTLPSPLRAATLVVEVENVGTRDRAILLERYVADAKGKGSYVSVGATTRQSPAQVIWTTFPMTEPGKYRMTVTDPGTGNRAQTITRELEVVKP